MLQGYYALATFYFRAGWLNFPLEPPSQDFALSEPLPWGPPGWLETVSDTRTCSTVQCSAACRNAASVMGALTRGYKNVAKGPEE